MNELIGIAKRLVGDLLNLMPSSYQRQTLKVVLSLFLEGDGHSLPEHSSVKSASSISRFLNQYNWS
ncbi:IS701 family transposase, partial [Magnetococcales bacterium HHB-1]